MLNVSKADEGEYWCEVVHLGVWHASQEILFGGEREMSYHIYIMKILIYDSYLLETFNVNIVLS